MNVISDLSSCTHAFLCDDAHVSQLAQRQLRSATAEWFNDERADSHSSCSSRPSRNVRSDVADPARTAADSTYALPLEVAKLSTNRLWQAWLDCVQSR